MSDIPISSRHRYNAKGYPEAEARLQRIQRALSGQYGPAAVSAADIRWLHEIAVAALPYAMNYMRDEAEDNVVCSDDQHYMAQAVFKALEIEP